MMTIVPDSPEYRRKVEELYEKYHKLLYAVSYNILKHHQDAEDAVIEAWEKIICHLDKLSDVDSQETKGFLMIIAERTAIDYYRKNKKRNSIQILVEHCESFPYFLTNEEVFEKMELYRAFRSIPKRYSEVLILYYVNGYSGKEIADLLGLREGTVMTRLSRGRKQLKKQLGSDW